jgi:uncharacterized protein YjhX (UPF0386 family)
MNIQRPGQRIIHFGGGMEIRSNKGQNAALVPGYNLLLWDTDLALLADGANVTAWADQSGNGYNHAQAGPGLFPNKQTVTNGGKTFPVARFDGNDYLTGGDIELFLNVSGLTVYAVFCSTRDGIAENVISKYDTGANQRQWVLGDGQWNVQDNPAAYNANNAVLFADVEAWQLVSGVWQPGALTQAWRNGISLGAAATPAVDVTDTGVVSAIGCTFTTGTPNNMLTGDIAAIVTYPTAHTTAQRQHNEEILAAKYGL